MEVSAIQLVVSQVPIHSPLPRRTPVVLWHNDFPPNHVRYERYLISRLPIPGQYLLQLRTGAARGGWNHTLVVDRPTVDRIYAATRHRDRRRTLRALLRQLDVAMPA